MRVAIVTGGNRGIGAAIVRRLARDGLAVMIGCLSDKDATEDVRRQVETAGGRAASVQAYVSIEEQAAALIGEAVARFGCLDVLVNNAAVGAGTFLADIDAAHVDVHLATNVRGLLLASKHAAARMGAGGCIVNVSSENGRSPVPGGAVYSATKAAVDAITKALARELGPRSIRVNSVCPGLIMTECKVQIVPEDALDGVREKTPLGRLGVPDDVARVVSFLASEDAAWVTGEVVGATGGYGL